MAWFAAKKASKRQGEVYVALDLGTEQIKALVCGQQEGRCAIWGSGTARHRHGTMRGGMVINIPEVALDVQTAVNSAIQQANLQPKKVVMSLSGDLVKSLITTVHYHRARPEAQIDANELKNIIYKAQWKAFEQIRGLISKEQEDNQLGIKLINTTVVDTRIDGYKVSHPLGFQGGMITISIFNAFAPLVHLGAMQAIADALGFDLVSIAAGPYALTKSLLVDNPEFSAVFIDIGGDTTDIAVVNEGGIFGMQNFALGGTAYTKNLANNLKVSPERAEQIKIDYSNGLLDKRSESKIKAILKSSAAIWVRGVSESLDEFSHLDVLPNKVFLFGGGAALPEVKNILLTKSWAEQLPFVKKPYPAVVSPTEIPNLVLHNQVEIGLSDLTAL
ncbi:TPA: hypothetical protein DCR79_02175, partial [Patescibacteria group bacterium]